MKLHTKVNESDLVTTWDDLERGTMVYIPGSKLPKFGIVTQSQEDVLTVETLDAIRTFSEKSSPSLPEVLAGIRKIPNFHAIEAGVILSRINREQKWVFREYVRVNTVYRNSGALNTVNAEVLNGEKKGEVYRFSPDNRTLTEELAGWQIED